MLRKLNKIRNVFVKKVNELEKLEAAIEKELDNNAKEVTRLLEQYADLKDVKAQAKGFKAKLTDLLG